MKSGGQRERDLTPSSDSLAHPHSYGPHPPDLYVDPTGLGVLYVLVLVLFNSWLKISPDVKVFLSL